MRRVWWTNEVDDRSWTGGAVATAITTALLVLAFLSMTRVQLRVQLPTARERTTVLRFTAPPPPAPPPLAISPRHEVPIAARVAPDRPSAIVESVPSSAAPKDPPVRDTTTSAASSPSSVNPLFAPVPAAIVSTFSGPRSTPRGLGASNSPTGFLRPTDPATIAARDSMAGSVISAIRAVPWRQLTPEELVAVRLQEAPGLSPIGRAARLPGEPMYAPLMNGGASVAVAMGIPVHGGPSKKARRRADSLDADYQARLRRLQEIVLRRRDWLRADSLRRDSIARARIHP